MKGKAYRNRLGCSYDARGNRKQASASSGSDTPDVTTYAANRLNQYSNVTYQSNSLQPNSLSPAYDLNGNLTYDGTNTYFRDLQIKRAQSPRRSRRGTAILKPLQSNGVRSDISRRNGNCYQLILVSNAAVQVASAYDAMGRRVRKIVSRRDAETQSWEVESTHCFFYDGWNVIRETIHSTLPSFQSSTNLYTWGSDLSGSLQGAGGVGGLLAVLSSGSQPYSLTAYYPLFDHNGNVERYVSRSGATVAAFQYDAFGNTISETFTQSGDNAFTHFRFSTKYWDAETGLVMFQLRPYNPELGRWMSRDKIGELTGIGLVSALENDLINDVDYLGLMSAHVWGYNLPGIGFVEPYNPNASPTIGPAPSRLPLLPDRPSFNLPLPPGRSLQYNPSGRWHETMLPNCPCEIPLDDCGFPKEGFGNGWSDPKKANPLHPGAAWEIRWNNGKFGASGQQCTYDNKGKLLTRSPSAGSADYYWFNGDINNFTDGAHAVLHGASDAAFFLLWKLGVFPGMDFDAWRPPNNGNNCPPNPKSK